ncbi:hypothetical protein [Ktedonospora formicarum]|uniref:Uncharacterized protein n=1 Tax=Ktedonospora formicarum TaxID=2778364 RepID=A0A8J3MTJ2_9CHLR|nr:hypothetical protein [Ktedonospora formicarum]GHO45986.1 hypothetical protein KSX_41490 [Ktedonospora formicarum]
MLSESYDARSWNAFTGSDETTYDWPDDFNGILGNCAFSSNGSKVAIVGDL